jgi:hypothetical protein
LVRRELVLLYVQYLGGRKNGLRVLLRLHASHLYLLELNVAPFEATTFLVLIIVIVQALLNARKALIIRKELILRAVLLGVGLVDRDSLLHSKGTFLMRSVQGVNR